jgi:hypothetical protein
MNFPSAARGSQWVWVRDVTDSTFNTPWCSKKQIFVQSMSTIAKGFLSDGLKITGRVSVTID